MDQKHSGTHNNAYNNERGSAQDIQDELFRNMPAEKKIKLASSFFAFAKSLNPKAFEYGTGRTPAKNRRLAG